MADAFNPQVPSPEPKNFERYSRGYDKDRSFETLFEGGAQLVSNAAQGTDQIIQQNIREDATKKVDEVRQLFGVNAVTAESSSNVPSEISSGRAYAEKLKAAYNAGTIRESYYYGQLQSKVKELRTKYPGYDEQVDNIISDITGVTPANAIVSALRREAAEDKANQDAATNRYEAFINQNLEYIYKAFPDFDSNSSKYQPEQVRAVVGRMQASEHDVKVRQDEIALSMAENNFTEDKVWKAASTEVSNAIAQRKEGVYNILGSTYNEVQKKLQDMTRPGAEPDANTMTEMLQQFNVMRQAAAADVQNVLNRQLPDGSTYATWITPEQRQALTKQATDPIDSMIESITNKDWGALSIDASIVKASTDREKKNIIETLGVANKYAAIKDLYGPEIAGQLLSHPSNTMLSDLSTALSTYIKSEAALGTSSASEAFQEVSNAGEPSPQAYINSLDTVLGWITGDIAGGKATEAAVDFLFGPDNQQFLSLFSKEEQTSVYNKLVNPKVSKALKTKASDEDWQAYTRWAYTNFTALFRQEAADVQNAISNRKWLDVKWNPEAGQFIVKNNAPRPSIFDIGSAVELDLTSTALNGVRRLNLALSSVKSVVDQDGGDMTKQMDLLIKGNLGINTDAMKEGSFLDQMKKAIKDWIKVDEPEPGPDGKPGKDESKLEPSLIQ